MIKVIINADDFGLDENRTLAIMEAYQQGWITTTTIMVNMPYYQYAVELAKNSSLFYNIGLHLNLTEGKPLTDKIKKSPIFCNEDGTFNAKFHHSKKYRLWLPNYEREAVKMEINEQIDRYREMGLTCFHIDSHHHVHTDYSITTLLMPIVKKKGFKTIRLSRNIGCGLSPMKILYKYIINKKMASSLKTNADYFCIFADFLLVKESIRDGSTIEIMTHPLYSRNGKVDMLGQLTEYHGNYQGIKQFFCKKNKKFLMMGYKGNE